ncbi:MAG TPA: hypothetical protein VMS64_02075 [Candidatus Methylomirabilis sp.]|nr:hypothetical protein [Candidatus Methylomirabilis sp.]
MDKDIFKERGHSLEEEYIRKQEAKLVEKLRERGRLEEIAEALAVKLQVDDPGLLRRIIALGVTLETGPALLLAPLVQVAWAEGEVTDRERETVLRIASERGLEKTSRAYAKLEEWLRVRPANELFDTAVEAIKSGISVLSPEERTERAQRIVAACHQVAEASGGLFRLLGLSTGVSSEEESILDTIAAKLRGR